MAEERKTLEEIMAALREAMPELRQRYKVRSLGVFGSWVRGENSCRSDLDLLVEFDEPTFDNYMGLKFQLQDLFGVEVDLVLADSLKPRIRPYIEREVVYA